MTSEGLVLEALKECVSSHTRKWAMECAQTDKEFSYSNGVWTGSISRALGVPTKEIRLILKKAEKKGLVYSRVESNSINWWPVGYLDEIRQGQRL